MLKGKTISENRIYKDCDGRNNIELTFSDDYKITFIITEYGDIQSLMYDPNGCRWCLVNNGNLR